MESLNKFSNSTYGIKGETSSLKPKNINEENQKQNPEISDEKISVNNINIGQRQNNKNPVQQFSNSLDALEVFNQKDSTESNNIKFSKFLKKYNEFQNKESQILDLTSMNLSNLNLSNFNLDGAILSRANLKGTILPQSLKNIRFYKTDLTNRNLSKHHLEGTSLGRAILDGATLPKNLKKVTFFAADLRGKDFSRFDLEGASLGRAKLEGTILPKYLKKVGFHSCDLRNRNFSDSNLEGVSFSYADLRNVALPPKLKDLSFLKANLSGVNLSHCNLEGANLKFIEYDSETKFPKLSELDNHMLLNLLKLSIDVDQGIKEYGNKLLKRELGENAQKTKDEIIEQIMSRVKNNPITALDTLYFLRLNNSQPKVKLDLDLNKNIKKYGLNTFEKNLIKTIFSGDNKQTVFKKTLALKTCLENESLRMPLEEFLTKASPKDQEQFLLEIYEFTKFKTINPNIVKENKYHSLLNQINKSYIEEGSQEQENLEISDYIKVLGKKKFEEILFNDTGDSRTKLTETERLEKLENYLSKNPELKNDLNEYLKNKDPQISSKGVQREIRTKLNRLSEYTKNNLLKTIGNEYQLSATELNNFIKNSKLYEIETLSTAFTYREKIHKTGKERQLIDKLICNYLYKKPNDFIVSEAKNTSVKDIKNKTQILMQKN